MRAMQSDHVNFFLQLFLPDDSALCKLFLLSTRVTRMLLIPRRVNRQKDVSNSSINISRLTLRVKHSFSRRTTVSPNLHLVEEETLECLPILQH